MTCRLLRRTCVVALLSLGAVATPARALPPHSEQHPRLLMDAATRPALLAEILGDPARSAVWAETLEAAESLIALPPDSLLGDGYWGFKNVEELSLVAQLADAPLAGQAEAAIEGALAWLATTTDPTPEPALGVLGPTLRLHDLVWGYDHAFSAASEAERQVIVDEILGYLEPMCTDPAFLVYLYNPLLSNKSVSLGAQLVLASLALDKELPDEPLVFQARATGEALLAKAWSDLFGADGSYREGVTYACWAMRTLLPTWEAKRRLEGAAGWEAGRAELLMEWLAVQLLPEGGGAYLNRNESNSTDFIVARHHSLLEWATRYGPQPEVARWLLRRSSGDLGHHFGRESDPVATLLWHTSGYEAAPDYLLGGRKFADGGLYTYRRGWPGGDPLANFLLTLEGTRFVGGHAQEDVGQFTLRALGHGFALDNGAGVTARQTQAHNLPTADGLGQHNAGSSIGTDGEEHVWMRSPFLDAVSIDMREAYTTHSPYNDPDVPWVGWDWSWGYDGGNPMQRASRTVLVFPGDAAAGELPEVFLRDDLIKADATSHVWRWRLHFAEGLAFSEIGGGQWRLTGANGFLRLFLHDPPRAGLGTSVAPFDNGNTDPNTQLLSISKTTDHFHFLWQLTPVATGGLAPTSSTERYAEGLRLLTTRGARERRLLVSTGAAPLVTAAGERLEGPLGWGVIENDGRALRTALIEGRRLRAEGRTLIGLEPTGSAVWDGTVLWLSSPALVFKAYAPGAVYVIADERLVGFERHGDFVMSVAHPDYQQPTIDAGLPPLRLEGPAVGRAPLRFAIVGPGALRAEGGARLEVYDVQGRRVATQELALDAGEAAWDGRDAAGRPAAAGVYFLRLRGAESSALRKVVILR